MEKISGFNADSLIREKKQAVTHCLNLECKKEQLQILIEKLSTISGQRLGLYSRNHWNKESLASFGLKKSSISDELIFAEESKDKIEQEIESVKQQLNIIDEILNK